MNLVNRYAPILLTVGLVPWVEGLVTIEWSYPYCLSQSGSRMKISGVKQNRSFNGHAGSAAQQAIAHHPIF
jgi:hypothetical protein